MNAKKAKKLRKHLRKEIGQGMQVLNKLIRKRPKWIPKYIWILFYLPLFKVDNLKHIYKTIK